MQPSDLSSPQPPRVFVVGAPRSGTSIVGLSLTRALGATSFSEGHMMPFFGQSLSRMLEAFEKLPARKFGGMLAARTDTQTVETCFVDMVRRFYDQAFEGGPVVDKTPSLNGVTAVPFIARTFPDARFVFCYRRALENVESRVRKWPNVPFHVHCREWAAIMSAWRELKADLAPARICEVEMRRLTLDPDLAAQRLCVLMGLGAEAQSVVRETLAGEKPSLIEGSSVERVLDFDTIDWSEGQRSVFLDLCRTELESWGYTLDQSYFAEE